MEDIQYTTREEVENYLLLEIDASFYDQIDSWITAMSNHIENTTKRRIYRAEEETFKYDGDGSDILLISDCNTISEIKVGDRVMEEGVDYFSYPQNKPYTSRIVLNGWKYPVGYQNVSITAIQAMSDTLPEDIKLACTILVAGIVNNQILNNKQGTTEKIGNYSITYKDEQIKDFENVKTILSGYTRITF